MSSDEIKEVIRDFVKFDVEQDFYKQDKKDELVKLFKKILNEDDTRIRDFLKKFFESTKILARDFSIIAEEGEAKEIKKDKKEEEPKKEKKKETKTADTVPESYSGFYRRVASEILYE